jgi:phage terminase large subunit
VIATEAEAWETLTDLLAETYWDPVLFNDLFLDRDPYWERQAEICRSLVHYKTTVAYTGNMVGKDYAVGGVVPWWLMTRPDSLVIVTGPGQTSIGSVTWKEIRRALDGAIMPFGGRLSAGIKTSPHIVEIAPGWQALGFSTTSVERASGQHAGQLLVIVEEASGVEEEMWDAIDSLGYERMLAIGNPIRAEGRFVDLIRQAEKDHQAGVPAGEAVNAIKIASTESPHASWDKSPVGLADRVWIDGMIRKYGENSLWVRSHIKAEIPAVSAEILIPEKNLDWAAAGPRVQCMPFDQIRGVTRIAVDLGEGVGLDSTCILVRDNLGILEVIVSNGMGLAEAAVKVAALMGKYKVDQENITYDKLGIGKDFPNHLIRNGITRAQPYAGEGSPADKLQFTNLRTEAAWRVRQRLDPGFSADARDPHKRQPHFHIPQGPWWPRMHEELKALTYDLVGKQTRLIKKADLLVRLGRSPDLCDAFCQSFAFDAR